MQCNGIDPENKTERAETEREMLENMQEAGNGRGKGTEPKQRRVQDVWKQQKGRKSANGRRRYDYRPERGVHLLFDLKTVHREMDQFGGWTGSKTIIPDG
jgi:hypothetical protein